MKTVTIVLAYFGTCGSIIDDERRVCDGRDCCLLSSNAPGPFFCDAKGNPTSKTRFVSEMRKALLAVGLQQDQYAGHSF